MQGFRTELENPIVEKDIIELERKIKLFRDGKIDEDKFRNTKKELIIRKKIHKEKISNSLKLNRKIHLTNSELYDLYVQNKKNYSETARQLYVSETAVRKRVKKYILSNKIQ